MFQIIPVILEINNQIADYIKPLIYSSNDPEIIQLKEQAFRDLNIGMIEATKGHYETALSYLREAIEISIKTKDVLLEAFSNFFTGETYFLKNDLFQSKEFYLKAYQVFNELGNRMLFIAGQKIREIEKEISREENPNS